MSIETWFFPASAGRAVLCRHLRTLGFSPVANPFFPGPKGSMHFAWFDERDYRSSDGVSASVFPINSRARKAFHTKASYGIWTRTSIRASSYDRDQQNRVNRSARNRFLGFFTNDHYGRNRYNPKETVTSTPAGRGIEALRSELSSELGALTFALPEDKFLEHGVTHRTGVFTKDNDPFGVWRSLQRMSPARTLHNAVLPFLVAAVEHFFSGVFRIMLRHHPDGLKTLRVESRKVSMNELMDVAGGAKQVEDIVSSWFSFQNLDSINKAFTEYFAFDVWKCLRRRRRLGRRMPLLADELRRIIDFRHGIVHRFTLDRELSRRDELVQMIGVVDAVIRAVADGLKVQFPKLIRCEEKS